ncbi:sel1 repeat family protein [Parashewanella curva]|uniref:Sel1 repeat family protein n=1 Tax=Parashewanella curva TaxID=2338552 RepID=A0A3L8Q0R5_9GAMM|nr:sel1 repeat family protein [Parashewanella curva]RLV59982.1 sel1 repeat family protein [Parashewanella curva]
MLRSISTILVLIFTVPAFAQIQAVDIYSVKQLSQLIHQNRYLQQVKLDDCQLVEDIEARAEVLKEPLYQFLWGEMLLTGTCVQQDSRRGMTQLTASANQGSNEALFRLARYYDEGERVIENNETAVKYALPAASGGYIPAQMLLVKLLNEGYGSPFDYEHSYRLLYHNVFDNQASKVKAEKLLKQLATKMPASIVKRAQKRR